MNVVPLTQFDTLMLGAGIPEAAPGNFAGLLEAATTAPTLEAENFKLPQPKAALDGTAMPGDPPSPPPTQVLPQGIAASQTLGPLATPALDNDVLATSSDAPSAPDTPQMTDPSQTADARAPAAAAIMAMQPAPSGRIALPQVFVGSRALKDDGADQVETEIPRRRGAGPPVRDVVLALPAAITANDSLAVPVVQQQPAIPNSVVLTASIGIARCASLPMQSLPDRLQPDRARAAMLTAYARLIAPLPASIVAEPATAEVSTNAVPATLPIGFAATGLKIRPMAPAVGTALPSGDTFGHIVAPPTHVGETVTATPIVPATLAAALPRSAPEALSRSAAHPPLPHFGDTPALRRPTLRFASQDNEIAVELLSTQQVNTALIVTAGAPTRASLPKTAAEPTVVETEALGDVAIALDRRDSALHVHFIVDRSSTAQTLRDAARQLDGALQAGGTRLDQLSVDVRGNDSRAAVSGDPRSSAPQSDGGGQRAPSRDPRQFDPPVPMRPRIARATTQDRFA